MKSLSKAQQAVVDKMSDGWELGIGMDFYGRAWLQKGGCGRGGESCGVHASTASALIRNGMVVCTERKFPLARYALAKK